MDEPKNRREVIMQVISCPRSVKKILIQEYGRKDISYHESAERSIAGQSSEDFPPEKMNLIKEPPSKSTKENMSS